MNCWQEKIIFKFIRFILKLFLISVVFLPLLLFLVLLGYSIGETPWVDTKSSPDHYDIARVKKIIKQHDPRHLKQGQTGYLSLSEQDINTLLLTGLSSLKKARAQTHFYANKVVIDLTIKLPENEYGQYANVSLILENNSQHLLKIDKINFGTLAIPGWLFESVWDFTRQYFYNNEEYKRLVAAVQMVIISQGKINIAYTADRTGVKFGTMAVASESRARFLQLQMSQIIKENDFMPKIEHLPEGLHEASFKRQYGTTETLRYKRMQLELDKRIGACRLYKK